MSENKIHMLKASHEIVLISRERLSINGVKEIINFDEKVVNIKTVCGELCIDGDNIHINVLNVEKGELEVVGKFNGINYFETYDGDKKNLLSRIFK